ncbi:uncharacterized protein LOC113271424 [Papaver somniferum]|uniref:uncharacterized protein LOC113271424 n=1 Tax=Papaver somniferum TaxID=3469 RepID=UPI000E705166|nr:uncharacterized protein LOC113271424 [Papaver somniferum]
MSEWWYNTNYHSSLKVSPFTALYGYNPPHLFFPSTTTVFVVAVEDYLNQRDVVLDILKDSLHKSQESMKFYAEKNRVERSFEVGDKVYLKLHPYRQASMALRRNLKLASKYYGPFTILHRIGIVSYKLQLLAEARIHSVFHASQLQKQIGTNHTPAPRLLIINNAGQVLVIPPAALASRTIVRNGVHVHQLLIHWPNATAEDAAWEDAANIRGHFTKFNP